MYREHLLLIGHVQKLLYHQVASDGDTSRHALHALPFFLSQTDRGFKGEFFPSAERRISFFVQSLTTFVPIALPVDASRRSRC